MPVSHHRPALLRRFYRELLERHGHQHWWPADSPWEMAMGAVLVQNTAWTNVERAIAMLRDAGQLTADQIAVLDAEQLAARIRPAGTHRVKARRLLALADWWLRHAPPDSDQSTESLRQSLLAVHGVGPETADCILLYAFGRPVFVVDAYTRRILSRHDLLPRDATGTATMNYAAIQSMFHAALPPDPAVYGEYHALLVEAAKRHCRSRRAHCDACPLRWHPRHPRALPDGSSA